MRNPRDVAVSYYYFTKMIKPVNYNGEFEDFFNLFLQGKGLNLIYVLLLIYEPKARKWCGVEFQVIRLQSSPSSAAVRHRTFLLSNR